jgi:hypothetical protein
VSIAAIHPPTAVFREEQNFGWWIYAILSGFAFAGVLMAIGPLMGANAPAAAGFRATHIPVGICVGMILPSVLVVGVLRMTTEVTPGAVRIWFGWVPTFRRSFDLSSVTRVEVIQYRPMRDYGGWGIRFGRDGERIFNARGNRGVRLYFADGQKMVIGSQNPESLARALEQAMRPAT